MLPKHKDQCEKKNNFFFYGKHTQIFSLFCTVLLFFILVLLYFFFWGKFSSCLFIKSPKQNKKIEYIKLIYFKQQHNLCCFTQILRFFIFILCSYIQSRQQQKKQSNFFIIIFEKIFLYLSHTHTSKILYQCGVTYFSCSVMATPLLI